MTKVVKFILSQQSWAHHIVYGAVRVHLIAILFLMRGFDVQAVNHENTAVVLNSCERCQSERENRVSPDVSYSITVSPTTDHECPWQCDADISSARDGGWLCLVQNGITSHINDSNVELFVHTQNSIFKKLEYYPNSWSEREMCIKTNSMRFSLKKIHSRIKIEFSKVHIQLQVLDIESKDRKLYLDNSYCSRTYNLLNSQIRVFNQPSEDKQVSYGEALTSLCGVSIKNLDAVNKSICFLYQPLEQMDCRNNWTFSVSVHGYTTEPQHMVYTLKCDEERARQPHAWCANKDLDNVTVIFQRSKGATKSKERPNMFQYVVLDYAGTAESLMEEKGLLIYGGQSSPNEDDDSTYIIYIVLGVTLLAITVASLLFVLYRKHKLSREVNREDQNGGNPSAQDKMLAHA